MEQFSKRFKRGDLCYTAEMEGKMVHYSWVQTEGRHYIQSAGRNFRIRKGEFWIYDCFTAEKARGGGIYSFMLTHLLKEFQNEGRFTRAIIYTTCSNRASRQGIERTGFFPICKLIAIKIKDKAFPLAVFPWQKHICIAKV